MTWISNTCKSISLYVLFYFKGKCLACVYVCVLCACLMFIDYVWTPCAHSAHTLRRGYRILGGSDRWLWTRSFRRAVFLTPEASLYPNNTFFKLLKSKVVTNIVFYIVTKAWGEEKDPSCSTEAPPVLLSSSSSELNYSLRSGRQSFGLQCVPVSCRVYCQDGLCLWDLSIW